MNNMNRHKQLRDAFKEDGQHERANYFDNLIHQGKRPDQIEYSTNISSICIIGAILILSLALFGCTNEIIPYPPIPDPTYYGQFESVQVRSDKHTVYVYPCDSDSILEVHYQYFGEWVKTEQRRSAICPMR